MGNEYCDYFDQNISGDYEHNLNVMYTEIKHFFLIGNEDYIKCITTYL